MVFDSGRDLTPRLRAACRLGGVEQALAEIRRVLKPDSRLICCEHGAAPAAAGSHCQDRLNPFGGA